MPEINVQLSSNYKTQTKICKIVPRGYPDRKKSQRVVDIRGKSISSRSISVHDALSMQCGPSYTYMKRKWRPRRC